MPAIPPPMPVDLQQKAEAAASKIQRIWIQKVKERRQQEMVSKNASDRVLAGGIIAPPGMYMHPHAPPQRPVYAIFSNPCML